jgi:TolA-binding protein
MAKRTYRTLLSMYPDNPRSPMVESELLAVLERDLPMEEINERKVSLFRKYNNKSAWARSIEDRDLVAEADSVAAHQLYDASLSYHQLGLQNNDSAAYASAAELYESYIHHYPTSPRANECHYNLAEILFSLGDYFRAAEEYMAVSKRYPDSKYRETAAWNAIVASQNLLRQEEEAR